MPEFKVVKIGETFAVVADDQPIIQFQKRKAAEELVSQMEVRDSENAPTNDDDKPFP